MTRFTVYVPYIVKLAAHGEEAEDEDDALNKVEGHASLCVLRDRTRPVPGRELGRRYS